MPEGVENKTGKDGFFPNGNFTFTDKFTSDQLDYRWIGVRTFREDFISTSKKGLKITPYETNIKAMAPISTLFQRQMHKSFSASTTLNYKPKSSNDLAGLVCYQNERLNYVFGITKKDKDYFILLERTENGESEIIASSKIDIKKPIKLQVVADGDDYRFNYSVNGEDFQNLGGAVSGDILSTNVAGGFTGALIGLYTIPGNDAMFK